MKLFSAIILALLVLTPSLATSATNPPRIGKLVMPPEYWGYILEAAEKYRVRPAVIAGVMAIESCYNPRASSEGGRCYGLMQLDRDVARRLGVDRRDPWQSIMGGAQILARLLDRYQGDLRLAVRAYNGTGNKAYLREVLKAVNQAEETTKINPRRTLCPK